jgi:hypothetical protein
MSELVDDQAPLRHRWKPSFKAWLSSSAISLAVLFLASWYSPALKDDAPYLALLIPLGIAAMFAGMVEDPERLFSSPVGNLATPLEDQPGWQRFLTLLIFRKHSPKRADVLFFSGCTVIYIAVFGFFFGIPNGILPFAIAVVINLIPSLFPCMIWNFLVLFLVAAVDYARGTIPELDDERTWLLRQVRNMY